jgi:hypothetical protein
MGQRTHQIPAARRPRRDRCSGFWPGGITLLIGLACWGCRAANSWALRPSTRIRPTTQLRVADQSDLGRSRERAKLVVLRSGQGGRPISFGWPSASRTSPRTKTPIPTPARTLLSWSSVGRRRRTAGSAQRLP